MAARDRTEGWEGVPAIEAWTCPECGTSSLVEAWEECQPYCEDCGSHDGRRCPGCGAEFDHVWGHERLADAQKGGKTDAE